MRFFKSNLFVLKKRTATKYKNRGHPCVQQCFLNSMQNFKANGKAALVIALGDHDNL